MVETARLRVAIMLAAVLKQQVYAMALVAVAEAVKHLEPAATQAVAAEDKNKHFSLFSKKYVYAPTNFNTSSTRNSGQMRALMKPSTPPQNPVAVDM
jgi:hypothetical protein